MKNVTERLKKHMDDYMLQGLTPELEKERQELKKALEEHTNITWDDFEMCYYLLTH